MRRFIIRRMNITFSRREFLYIAGAGALGARSVFGADTYVIADTTSGKVRGVEIEGIKMFKGVPYGGNTAGRNRFMPPTPPAKWTGVRDALEYGASAPQTEPGRGRNANDLAVAGAGLPAESEDCLVLNVWTPALNDGKKRPVMVWCHGGGFATGSGSSPITAGFNLARRGDVVVVTLNHRLNVLGFTNLSEPGGPDFSSSSDVGMMDIVQALQWVRDNITRFGGDPGTVTIFGQSGGGRKVATLLAMPSAKGLFHRAIIESGATLRLVEKDQGTRVAQELMKTMGLEKTQVKDLQMAPIERLMAAYFETMRRMNVDQMTMGFSPGVDGRVIPQHPVYPTASAISADVPLMLGSTRTELTLQSAAELFTLDDAGMRKRIGDLLGKGAAATIDAYTKANPGASPSDLYFLIASDYRYSGPVMTIADRRSALNKGPVYLYYWRWETPVDGGRLKAPHTIEIPFAFDNIQAAKRLTGGGAEAVALADTVSDTWLAFARTGNPNQPKLPAWTKYNSTDRPTMVFDTQSALVNDPIRDQRLAIFKVMS